VRWSRAISAVEHRQIGDQEYAKNQGEGEDHARNPGDDRIEPAAEEAGQYAEDPADEQNSESREDPDEKGGLGAIDRPGEDIAAVGVVAEDMPGAGSLERVLDVSVRRTFLSEQMWQKGGNQHQEGEQCGDDEDRLATQAAPGFPPAAGRGGMGCLRTHILLHIGYVMIDFLTAFHSGNSDPVLRHTKDTLATGFCPEAATCKVDQAL
jgi:hypothetical protein